MLSWYDKIIGAWFNILWSYSNIRVGRWVKKHFVMDFFTDAVRPHQAGYLIFVRLLLVKIGTAGTDARLGARIPSLRFILDCGRWRPWRVASRASGLGANTPVAAHRTRTAQSYTEQRGWPPFKVCPRSTRVGAQTRFRWPCGVLRPPLYRCTRELCIRYALYDSTIF